MKKLLWLVGGLVVAFLVAVISIPLFVDVDQYRPRIVEEANKRINGRLELGKLKLSLWGTIKIHADSIKLSVNGFPEPMVTTQQFHVEIPIMSVLTGSPQVIAVLDAPKISVVKEASGKMNAMELMKVPGSAEAAPAPAPEQNAQAGDAVTAVSAAIGKKETHNRKAPLPPAPPAADHAAAVPAPAPSVPAAPSASAPPAVPAIIAGARLGLRISGGDLSYADKVTHSTYQVVGLDVNAKNLGLGSEMTVDVKAPVKGASPTMTIDGPVTASIQLKPTLAGSAVKSVSGKVDLDATKLAVEMKGGAFHKTDAMPLTMHAAFDGSGSETLLKALDVQFTDYRLHGRGRVTMEPMTARAQIETDSSSVKLDKVQAFVPMAAAYDLKGTAELKLDVDWKPEALHASGDLGVDGGSFFLKDVLKAPMGFRVKAGFSESSLTITRASLTAPESDVELTGTVKNFLAPQFSFAITGKGFNVDKALVLPAPGAAPKKEAHAFFGATAAWAAAAAGDVNPMLELAKNPVVMGAAGLVTAQVQKVTAYNAEMTDVTARAQLSPGLQLKLLDAGLKAFGGSAKTSGEFDLKSPGLGYHSQGTIAGVSAKEALKSQFPKYQNTLEGLVDANWNVSGTAFPKTQAMHNLKGTAKLNAHDGAVKSVDFQESINGVVAKIPFLKGQKVTVDNGFKTLSCDVSFANGVIRAEPLQIYPRNQGLVIKGKSTIQENLDQETFLDVYDPQNQLPKELRAAAGKPAIQLHITGQITNPHTDYGYTLSRVAQNAGKNVLMDQGLKALGVNSQPGMSDQDKLKKAAEELKKKFHF